MSDHIQDTALVKLDAAQHALAECKTVMEAKQIADVAEAARVYLQRTNASVETVNRAAEIRTLAERQMGAFLQKTPDSKTGPKQLGNESEPNSVPTLTEIGITKRQSATAQKLAEIPDSEFSGRVATLKANGVAPTPARVLVPSISGTRVKYVNGKRRYVVTEITSARAELFAKTALSKLCVLAAQADALAYNLSSGTFDSAFLVMGSDERKQLIEQFSKCRSAVCDILKTLRRYEHETNQVEI